MENNTNNLYLKLSKAKSEIGKISKDSTNPFFKSKYFDINKLLEHVEPILHNNGLMVLQPIIDGKVCTNIIEIETGVTIESSIQMSDQKDPQKLGSEITYFRRYTLQSLLSLQAEDDDGNKASAPVKETKTKESLTPNHKRYDGLVKALALGKATLKMAHEEFYINNAIEKLLLEDVQEYNEFAETQKKQS